MRKFLAVMLSFGLVWGSAPAARAQVVTRAAAPVAAVPSGVGAAGYTTHGPSVNGFTMTLPVLTGPSAALPTPVLSARPQAAPAAVMTPAAAAPSAFAAAAGAQAVERHPALSMISAVQKAGGQSLLTQLDAAKTPAQFEAVAAALPAGAARESITAFGKSLAAQKFGGGGESMAAIYDNSRRAELMPVETAAKASGFWTTVAGWSPLGSVRRYALKKAEDARPKAATIDTDKLKVPAEKLRWTPDAKALPAKASEATRGARRMVGQDRALESLEFGLKIEDPGYNVIVSGAEGTGRETAVREMLSELAPKRATPGDLVAAVNFADRDNPHVLKMEPGEGAKFLAAVDKVVENFPGAMNKALNQGEVGQLRKQVQAQLEAGAADRQKAFQREVAQVKVVGGFGIEISAEQAGEGKINVRAAITKDGKAISPEEAQKALEGTGVTFQQAMADAQAKAKPLLQKFGEMMQSSGAEAEQAQMQLMMLEQKVAGAVVSELAADLAGLVSGAANREEDEGHTAWRASAEKKFKAWETKVAKVKVGGIFGIAIGEGLAITYEGKPVSPKRFASLKEAGKVDAALTWEALVGAAMAAVQPLSAELEKVQAGIEAEHQKLHENDLPMTADRQRAIEWVQSFAQDLVMGWRAFSTEAEGDPAERYNVGLLVDNAKTKGAPVVFEPTPTFNNLFGYAEDNKKIMMMPNGGMVKREGPGGPTLKAGSFLKANGGFLVLNLLDTLREPGVYQSLMRMIRNGKAEIVEDGLVGLMTAKQGATYPIETKVKVVFIGAPYLKMLLAHNDEDFARLFHAAAEFDNSFKIAADTVKGYLSFMREVVTSGTTNLLDFGREAIAGVLESAAAMAESNEKLTAQFGLVQTLMHEASFWARQAGRELVAREDVDKAVSERVERQGSGRRRMKELYANGIFRVQIAGSEVGQNNGLAVMGDFGVPSRITYSAYARPGSALIVSADQAANSTGSSFDKSIADIKGFLNNLFGKKRTVPVEVSIAFEQQYGGIDGDSATQTMTYGVLSALSGVKIKQGIAMTGSMDQKGNVQVIGGVNYKIEGYFDVVAEMLRLKGREMDGEQGIMIPVANIPDLTLRADIVAAVKAGKFHIWAVSHVSQGVEILTGEPYSEVLRKAELYIASVRAGGAVADKK
ncbi:MAG: AAA family ATPase [Elusimicrobia bacterium]|nr:AAA family ATPase [Elusimicrobiota bacterium]